MYKLLLAWPDEIKDPKFFSRIQGVAQSPEWIAAQIKLGNWNIAEANCLIALAQISSSHEYRILLAHIRWLQLRFGEFQFLVESLWAENPTPPEIRWLFAQLQLQLQDLKTLDEQGIGFWRDQYQFPLLLLSHTAAQLQVRRFSAAEDLLNALPKPWPLEAFRLKARMLAMQSRHKEALDLLQPLSGRAANDRHFWTQLLEAVIDARSSPLVVPTAREALGRHGEFPELLCHVTTVKLFQRQPALARRSALLQQVWGSIRPVKVNLANQLCTYDMGGHSDWLQWTHDEVTADPIKHCLLNSNMTMQLASVEAPGYKAHIENFLSSVEKTNSYKLHKNAGSGVPRIQNHQSSHPLRIAWVIGDLCPHPVSRFLLSFLEASIGQRFHEHYVVSVTDHGTESWADKCKRIKDIKFVDVSSQIDHHKVAAIRSLKFDLAIDLSGWTGGNFIPGFIARMAPVQVNYLGYFASAGILNMDYWLGDNHLFPAQFNEWHTEKLWRLKRPFLAWQPCNFLPESSINVTESPFGEVHFGSFNHNRKFSDLTLKIWGLILQKVPKSRLVLKANSPDDPSTQILLRRRMLRAGLDPERVEWLPLAPTSKDHLLQYRYIDIALDPMPNGGCTTTAEALWMGVPVVTLAGSNYVSRMSTAVLMGAGLESWVAQDISSYIDIASNAALDVKNLRNNRLDWRKKILESPLGNAKSLMFDLEKAFTEMYQEKLHSGN